jgi:hypothetical protein
MNATMSLRDMVDICEADSRRWEPATDFGIRQDTGVLLANN